MPKSILKTAPSLPLLLTGYGYDDAGRVTSVTETEQMAAGGSTADLLSYTKAYTYDTNNNRTGFTLTYGGTAIQTVGYTYDNLNRLSTVSEDGTVQATYTYDTDGICTAKSVGTERSSYLLDGGNVVGELQNSTVSATYLRGANLISREADNSTSYYLYNAHGDVTGLTNETGTVSKTYNYTAFGIEQNPDATDENPFHYCGEYYDTETGTYYLRARYYDPTLGRFTQMDTYRGDPSDPLTLNLYTYCLNNPVCYVDSTGNAAEDVTRAIARAVIANPLAVRATQQGAFPKLFELAGFIQDRDGIYHAHRNAWQQIGGYNDFYDMVFYYGTSMDKKLFDFSSGGRNYVLWAWKGDYLNLGAGAELGIYSNISGFAGHGRFASPIAEHWLVDTNLAMKMTLTLTDKDGNLIFHYAPDEEQWWITGFDPFSQNVQAGDLTATYTVAFNDKQMYQDFYNKYGDEASKYWDSRWSFDPKTYTATFIF